MNLLPELKEIELGGKDEVKAKNIFFEAFPLTERPPFWFLSFRASKTNIKFYGIYVNSKFKGFAYVIEYMDLAYLLFFALKYNERGKGIGSAAIEKLKALYAKRRLFLSLEPLDENAKNYSQRMRRHTFYRRHGFKDMPFMLKEYGEIYAAMSIGGIITATEYTGLINEYLGFFKWFVEMKLMENKKLNKVL